MVDGVQPVKKLIDFRRACAIDSLLIDSTTYLGLDLRVSAKKSPQTSFYPVAVHLLVGQVAS